MEKVSDEVANLMQLFKSGNIAMQRKFLETCPPSIAKEAALKWLHPEYLELTLMAFCMVADTYSRGINPELGVAMNTAAFLLAQEGFQADRNRDFLKVAGQSTASWLLALQALGRHGQTLLVATEAERWLKEHGHNEELPKMILYRCEAYLDSEQFDDAEDLLAQTDWQQKLLENHATYSSKLADLKKRLEKARTHASTLPGGGASEHDQIIALREQLRQQVQFVLNSAETMGGINVEQIKFLMRSVEAEIEKEIPASLAEWATQTAPLMNALSDFFTGGSAEGQVQNQKRIRNAGLIFTNPKTAQDSVEINKSIPILLEALEWSRQRNFISEQNDCLWTLYICYNRTNREPEAIEVLQQLRSNLEETRRSIADPLKRAGVMTNYPHLFGALCHLLCKNNRAAELLDAMEGAKGRVIADVLSGKRGEAINDRAFSEPATQLPKAMKKVGAHYLSYFVDDNDVYAVLVARDGSLHHQSIELGRQRLREYAKQINPSSWGKSRTGLLGTKSARDLPALLAPLVVWLEPLAEAGLIREGDHLCYCPDAELHLIPLQLVAFRGKPLVDYLSVSRIQGALALKLLLSDQLNPPKRFIAVEVSAKQDRDEPEKLAAFKKASAWLAQQMPGEIISDEAADFSNVYKHDWTRCLVHFATHGTFPREGQTLADRDPNPFTASGFILSSNNQLPDLNLVVSGMADDTLLTPRKALELDFSGSHVTMQACVSGLAKEGVGGDALGLEWALIQAGASSLLATHWNVDAASSADFSLRFYRNWLLGKQSKAEAWRNSVLELIAEQSGTAAKDGVTPRDKRPRLPAAYYWASVSLSGDWR
jgi:CHAT domain-containing protein